MSDPPNIMQAPEGPSLTHIATRVLNRPLLLHPTKAEIILQVLQGRLSMDGVKIESLRPDANQFLGNRYGEDVETLLACVIGLVSRHEPGFQKQTLVLVSMIEI